LWQVKLRAPPSSSASFRPAVPLAMHSGCTIKQSVIHGMASLERPDDRKTGDTREGFDV
jgi:hypothetical protein